MSMPKLRLSAPSPELAAAPTWRREPYLLLFPLGALLGAEPAGDLLPQFHHPPVALREIVGERHNRVRQEAEHVRLSRAEPQQQVVTDRRGGRPRGLAFVRAGCAAWKANPSATMAS